AIVAEDGTLKLLTGAPLFGDDAAGGSLFDHVHPQDVAIVAAFLESSAAKPVGEPQELECRMRFADATHRHVVAIAMNLTGDERVAGLVLTIRDVEARKAFEEQLRQLAFHDDLTGLANRALFYDRVEHALVRGVRNEGQMAVLFIDLDDFKAVNDERGHADGDEVLREVA